MEFLLVIFVLFLLFKIVFGRNAKAKNRDAILGVAVSLGVPRDEAIYILDSSMKQLSMMLHMTSMKESLIRDKPSYERMAHCIYILYKKQQSLPETEYLDEKEAQFTGLDTDMYEALCCKLKAISERDSLKYNNMIISSRNEAWGRFGFYNEFYFSNDELEEAEELVNELRNLNDPTLVIQITNRPLEAVIELFNNEHRSITSTGFTVRDKATGHILAAKLYEGVFLGKVLMPEQGLSLDISSWKENEYPFKDDYCYEGFENGFNSSGNWWFCIETEIPFSSIADLAVSLSKNTDN